MRPDDWLRVKEVFAAALPLAADVRLAYLVTACGDDHALRQHVEQLLESHERAQAFLEDSAQVSEGFPTTQTLDGQRIGPYQLSSRIGSGGMGHVYRAHDTRLGRTVAIKVLPPHVASDHLTRERFEREARAVAALNHPNICTLHDIGHHDGIDFLVMEHLEGETLAARLEKGPLTLKQSLQYAVQIASALDRVHRAGIVHRDLKPGNIMLTTAGIKLLDFGLAKATSAKETQDAAVTRSPDITSTGVIVGTVQYMAPEQLDGKPTDARVDIFAFGAVLYEMISGRRAFNEDSHSSVIAAIRTAEPPTSLRLSMPIDRIVRICLAKDPDDRWQTVRDLLHELTWIAEAGSEAATVVSSGDLRKAYRIAWVTAGVAIFALAALSTVGYRSRRASTNDPLPARFAVSTPTTSDPMSFALSPDGRQLAFVANADGASKVWVRPLDDMAPQVLPGTEGASFPFWAPDGRAIAFFADGKLKRLDLDGGMPRVLADAPIGRGGTWSRDGVIVFAPTTASALMRVSAAGGTTFPATRLASGQNSHRWPQFLPDGRRFLFLSTQGQSGAPSAIIGALDSDALTHVLEEDTPAVFAPPDQLLFVRQGILVAMEFDAERGVASGDPVPLVQPIGVDTNLARAAFSVSETGVLAHRTAIAGSRQLVWVDRRGNQRGTVGPADDHAMAAPELTRDGRRVAIFRTLNGNSDVWLINVAGGVSNRFTFNPKPDVFPIWSPDGGRVVFTSVQNGNYNLVERPATGSGDDQQLLPRPELRIPTSFSSDGRFLLFSVQVPQTGVDLWALPFTGDRAPFPVVRTPFDEMGGQFSADGRWVAYQSNASGRMEVYVSAFATTGGQQQVSSSGGSQPRWARDGKELFYVAADGRMMVVVVRADRVKGTLDAETPKPMFPTRLASGANIPPGVGTKPQYDVDPDGRFLMNVAVEGAITPPINVALNWRTGLKK